MTKIKTLEAALIEMEATWAAAEAARITALNAAEVAWEIARSVRYNWKRGDGNAICEFSMRAREIAVQGKSRAKLSNETKITDDFLKELIKKNEALKEKDFALER